MGRPQAVPWWFGAADIGFSAYFALFVVAIGFVFTWARSTGAPLVPITAFITVAALAFGYPAIGRVLRRHARIKRSAYGSVFLNLAWPPPGGRRYCQAQLLWPAASTDPPQFIGPSDPQAVADLSCSAQLAERAHLGSKATHAPG